MNLPEKIIAIHHALRKGDLPHAFGGALALAWCTQRARGTIDIDINIFVEADQCDSVFASLPGGIAHDDKQQTALREQGQVRLWWDKTPVDIFLNTTDFHYRTEQRIRWELFGGEKVPFIACMDVAVFKAFFNRTQDWADLEAMRDAGTLDIERVISTLIQFLGKEDERIDKLNQLRQ